MRLVWTRMKLVIEPSAAVGLAVVLAHPDQFAGRRVAVVLTGGNVDIDRLPWAAD
jgi:threonine dehydratase